MASTSLAMLNPCTTASFTTPDLFGANFISLSINLVTKYTFPIPDDWRYSQPSESVVDATFCYVTVPCTHPGQNDTIYLETRLPTTNYNGILKSSGGGGWVAERLIIAYDGMIGAIADGMLLSSQTLV